MRALVMYDSAYGNTEKVAATITETLKAVARVKQLPADHVVLPDLKNIDLLVVGSPTQGGRPMKPTQDFISTLSTTSLKGIRVAAFDTRIDVSTQNLGLRSLMKTIGFAAPKIARALRNKGGTLIAPPEGFIVGGKEGPITPEELSRAQAWAQILVP